MGCGCSKKNANVVGAVGRQTIFQALNAQGAIVSEHDTPMEARAAATAAGGRVRVTSRNKASV